ncbi:MAG: thioesterase [Bacillota bacterium]|nr:thioesterase [Bacillota bacterium]
MFEEEIKLPYCLGDINSQLPLSYLFDYMINIGTLHVEALDLSTKDLLEKNISWMIYQVKIKIHQLAQVDTKIKISTYVSKVDKLRIYRQVNISDQDGKILIEASFIWLLVDLEKMKVIRPLKEIKAMVQNMDLDTDLEFTKFKDLESYDTSISWPIYKSDLDYNKHVHSGAYIRWLTDLVDLDNKQLREFEIYFKDQVLQEDQLEILKKHQGPNYYFQINKNGQGAVYAKSLWQEDQEENSKK